MKKLDNLFDGVPEKISKEIVDILASSSNVRVEKRVSPASNVPSHVYDQDEGELVVLAHGYAELELQKGRGNQIVKMRGGDYINIEPHSKHRVLRTNKGTTWLCVFYK